MDYNTLYQGSCFDLINFLDDESVDLFVTSPPYADIRKYGGDVTPLHPDTYVDWVLPLFNSMFRKLKPSGSIIWNIDDKCHKGGRHPFVFELAHRVSKETALTMYDYYIWKKLSCLPMCGPRRINHITEFIFHFCKKPKEVKWFMDRVRVPYADSTLTRYNSEIAIYTENDDGFKEMGAGSKKRANPLGKIPSNVLEFQTNQVTRGNKHPAPFNRELPEWFIKALTDEGDLVVDPFMGSGTTALVCHSMNRNWIGFELNEEYVDYANERLMEQDNGFF